MNVSFISFIRMYENRVRVFRPQKEETIRGWKKDLAQDVVLWQAFVNLVMNI